jgi:tetratricopeptide (TPR) repeat protein
MEPPAGLSREAGTLLLREGHYELACTFLRRSTAEFPEANLDLAAALYFKGATGLALAALKQNPEDRQQADAVALRALISYAQQAKTAALPLLNAIDDRSILNPHIASEAAVLLSELGDSTKALATVERTSRNSQVDAQLDLTRSVLLARLRRNADAERAIHDVENRWPDWDLAYAAEALLLEESGRLAAARIRFEIGAALAPDDPVIQCLRGHFAHDSDAENCSCATGIWRLLLKDCL